VREELWRRGKASENASKSADALVIDPDDPPAQFGQEVPRSFDGREPSAARRAAHPFPLDIDPRAAVLTDYPPCALHDAERP
jgi:hypothetical protein